MTDPRRPRIVRHLRKLASQMDHDAEETRATVTSAHGVVGKLALAKLMLAARRSRDPFFPADLFGEPAWDLLLHLYIAYREGQGFDLPAAARAAGVGTTVVARWVAVLVQRELVEGSREARPRVAGEAPPVYYLSDRGVTTMEACLDHYLQGGVASLD